MKKVLKSFHSKKFFVVFLLVFILVLTLIGQKIAAPTCYPCYNNYPYARENCDSTIPQCKHIDVSNVLLGCCDGMSNLPQTQCSHALQTITINRFSLVENPSCPYYGQPNYPCYGRVYSDMCQSILNCVSIMGWANWDWPCCSPFGYILNYTMLLPRCQ